MRCSVMINPILRGSGLKIKVVEALCAGLGVVSTSKGLEGMRDAGQCEAIVVADSPVAFATGTVRLANSPIPLSSTAQDFAQKRFSCAAAYSPPQRLSFDESGNSNPRKLNISRRRTLLFNSLDFAWFLVVVLILHRLMPPRCNALFITAVSYIFYGWWDWRFLILIFGSTLLNYLLAIAISRVERNRTRDAILTISIFANLGLLAFFKYAEFLLENVRVIATSFGLALPKPDLGIILPVGISFFTFQTLSYVVDVWRRDIKATTRFDVFAAFVAFFPQLVAGPIERAADLLPQLQEKRIPNNDQLQRAVWPVLWGFFLKVFLADNLARLSDHCYSKLETCSGLDLLLCHYAFALQIFGDFAGYSFIAMGFHDCSESNCLSTSDFHTSSQAQLSFGGTGISPYRSGCETISTFRSVVTECQRVDAI